VGKDLININMLGRGKVSISAHFQGTGMRLSLNRGRIGAGPDAQLSSLNSNVVWLAIISVWVL
jgi:hypothetical protein